MSRQLKTGELHNTLEHFEDKTDLDKFYEEEGLPARNKKAILHFYTLFFIVESDTYLTFYSTTKEQLFSQPKIAMPGVYSAPIIPQELLDVFGLFTTKFDRPFTPNFKKINYRRAKKIWVPIDIEFPEASPNNPFNPLIITYFNDDKKYSLDVLFIYRQINGHTERLDIRDIDEDFLKELFLMDVVHFPEKDFDQSHVFFDFYLNLFAEILETIPRKVRPVDIDISIVDKKQ